MNEKQIIAQEVKAFQEEFRETTNECQKFCYMSRAKEYQVQAREKLKALETKAIKLKQKAITTKFEDAANALLCFEKMTSAIINELDMWIALKDDEPGAAWDFLVNAQMAIISAMQAHSIASNLDSYAEHLSLLEHLLFPAQMFFSPGLIIREARCSICGQEYGECDHAVGKPYMGEICSRLIIHADMEEGSIVDKPANKHARIISFTDQGVHRDFLTWRVIPSASSTPQEAPENEKTVSDIG